MKSKFYKIFLLSILFPLFIFSREDGADLAESLCRDMQVVNYWNNRLNDKLPVTYNHLLQGGYVNMPSARMGEEGEIAFGYSSVPPYRNYNFRCQLIDRLEVTGNYRIFRGVDDPILTPLGFGDLSDKGVNVKFSLFSPEDSNYSIPGLAIGLDDFLGTRSFRARYVVLTQVFRNYDLEFSLGIGQHRIQGVFGGIQWMPFRRSGCSYLEGITIAMEYDAVPYHRKSIEKHPKGRKSRSPINASLKYRLWNSLDLSIACVRGNAFAFSVSTFYNFGNTKGFLPKIDNPLPYQAPINHEPIGWRRPEDVMIQEILFAMRKQGFDLLEATLFYDLCEQKTLRLHTVNLFYATEQEVRTRFDFLLAGLIPIDIEKVIVVIEAEGFPIQEYHYPMACVRLFGGKEIGAPELHVLTPLREVSFFHSSFSRCLFKKNRDLWNLELFPRTHTFFGSAKGKFKYALGVNVGLNGYLYDDLYYSLRLGCTFISNLHHLHGIDRLNPSQLLNVRTDVINYYCQRGITIDEAYLQKSWNMGCGWYSRIAAGHFEEEYGGVASEILYYPLHGCWAVGVEGAFVRKRTTTGLGFSDTIRKLDGFNQTFRRFKGSQYFLDLYYEWREAKLDFKMMAGKFLANDIGARFEVMRYFPSGLRVTLWYTRTNGNDKINGKTYHDKGVAFSLPLDIFYTYSDRSRWGYGMSAWLRDVGVFSETGMKLYESIREHRN